jgi:hypothetical protein
MMYHGQALKKRAYHGMYIESRLDLKNAVFPVFLGAVAPMA